MSAVRLLALPLLLTLTALTAAQQLTPEQAAGMVLGSARKAYNDKQYALAATRFREFLQKHGNHKDMPAARYGLALCLIEGEPRDFDKALEQLGALANARTFADYPGVLYYTGLCRRAQGLKAPANAAGSFAEAARQFDAAAKAFLDRAKDAKPPAKGVPPDLEWAARARCDQAEMLLRTAKPKEARQAVASFLKDKRWLESRQLALGHYYAGLASFEIGDYTAAGKSLGRTAVLGDEVFGTHARYLLARVHHLNTRQNEREEARGHYQKVLSDHDAAKKAAAAALPQVRGEPDRKARLEALVKGPAPEHVARAALYLGVLQYEAGRFAEALEHFKGLVSQNTYPTLAPEARLRLGHCQVMLKQNDDAIKTLAPLVEKDRRLDDQALFWTARAQLNKADAAKPESYKIAIETFKKAADRAGQMAGANPPDARARARRGEMLMDLAEAQIVAKQYKEAAATYATVLNDKLAPEREDEAALNQATAYQLAGDYAESDRACERFRQRHKGSTLLPAVMFRQAENASLRALASAEAARHNDDAIKRYAELIERYPEYAHVNLARQGLGMAYYRKGDLERAQKTLEAVPAGDRAGALASVSYALADIYLRQAPARADDAVTAGKLEEKLRAAAAALEAYVAAAGDSPRVPDALLKHGHALQRLAGVLAKPEEQKKALEAARDLYKRVLDKHPNDAAVPRAVLERAKALAALNDPNGALNELKRFQTDPLRKSPLAPLALLQLATIQRGQNRPADAAATLAACRKEHEGSLKGDKARSAWVVLLAYHHAAALREAGKPDEARPLFEQAARDAADRPEGWDAALRAGQCRKEEGEKKIAEARKQLASANLAKDARGKAEALRAAGVEDIKAAVAALTKTEESLRARKVEGEEAQRTVAAVRARLLYECAWGWRALAEQEVESARRKLQLERWQRRRDEVARATPEGQNPPAVPLPAVDAAEVPAQPAEAQSRARYREIIKAFPELAVNADARFELAELLAARGEHDEAVKLLQGALEAEKEPSAELADRIKVRLAASLLDRGARKLARARDAKDRAAEEAGRKDVEAALEQLQTVTANPKSAQLAAATHREAECLLLLGKADEAIKLLVKFRDGPYQHVAGTSDRALLRLGQAYADKKEWNNSRAALQALADRFGQSAWAAEARYGIGWALQNEAKYDEAVASYARVTEMVATRLAARAQLNIGLCRLAQKRYGDAGTALLVVPFTYDYAELSALALLEAARALELDKQPAQAVKLLRRVERDHKGTPFAEAAAKRIKELTK